MKALVNRRALMLALLALVACSDDPAQPEGTGTLVLDIVPTPAPTLSSSSSSSRSIDRPVRITKDGSRAVSVGARRVARMDPVDCEGCQPRVSAREGAASAFPPLDRVEVRLSGPTSRMVTLTNSGSAFEGTIDGLPVGTYTVKVVGFGVGEVTYFGTTSNVRVTAEQTTTATVAFNEFVTTLAPFTTPTFSFVSPIDFPLVPNATVYRIEVDTDAAFSDPIVDSIPDNTGWAWFVLDVGTYNLRIRAGNADVPSGISAASNVESWVVLADTVGDSPGTAYDLGAGTAAAGRYFNINITSGDQDWYRIGLISGNRIGVQVLSSSLIPTSNLDPIVRIEDALGNVLASNDDADSTTLESEIPPFQVLGAGDYFIGVTALNGATVGHYEMILTFSSTAAESNAPGEQQEIPLPTRRIAIGN